MVQRQGFLSGLGPPGHIGQLGQLGQFGQLGQLGQLGQSYLSIGLPSPQLTYIPGYLPS